MVRKIWFALGLLSAAAGAVFILLGIGQFGFGGIRSVLAPFLWLWVVAHAAAAMLSVFFFRLAASHKGEDE